MPPFAWAMLTPQRLARLRDVNVEMEGKQIIWVRFQDL